jgi:GrpB-like predicted nucleotidyltransferase (UPF0157 family)
LVLVDYCPDWPGWFDRLRARIAAALEGKIVALHHIGSTSIPGLAAKPIIDMDIVIEDYDRLPGVEAGLGGLGYRNGGDQGITDRLAFKRNDAYAPHGEPPVEWIEHHLYVCPMWSRELSRHLSFRDYLRQDQAARDEYARIKREIEIEVAGDGKKYAEVKEIKARAFVEGVLARALAALSEGTGA